MAFTFNKWQNLNQKSEPEEKKEETLMTADEILAELKNIRDTVLTANPYHLTPNEAKDLEIVLNTLDFLTIEIVKNRNYQNHNTVLQPPGNTAPIHLENYPLTQFVQLGAAYAVLLNVDTLIPWTNGPLQKGNVEFTCLNDALIYRVIDIDGNEKSVEFPWYTITPLIGELKFEHPYESEETKQFILVHQKTFLRAMLGASCNQLAFVEYANDVAKSYQGDNDAKVRSAETRYRLLQSHSSEKLLEALEKISLWKHPDWLNNLLITSLMMPFIQSIKRIKNVENGLSMKHFCGKLDGNCIDARTRDAFTYARSDCSEFSELLGQIFDEMKDICKIGEGSYSFFGCIAAILNDLNWGKTFRGDSADTGIHKLPGKLDEQVLSNESESMSVVLYLKNILLADPDNSFLTLYKNLGSNYRTIFFKLLFKETEFLENLTFTPEEQRQFDELFEIPDFVAEFVNSPIETRELLLSKASPAKILNSPSFVSFIMDIHIKKTIALFGLEQTIQRLNDLSRSSHSNTAYLAINMLGAIFIFLCIAKNDQELTTFRRLTHNNPFLTPKLYMTLATGCLSHTDFLECWNKLSADIPKEELIELFIKMTACRPENLTVLLSPAQLVENCLNCRDSQPEIFLDFVRALQATPAISFDYIKQFLSEGLIYIIETQSYQSFVPLSIQKELLTMVFKDLELKGTPENECLQGLKNYVADEKSDNPKHIVCAAQAMYELTSPSFSQEKIRAIYKGVKCRATSIFNNKLASILKTYLTVPSLQSDFDQPRLRGFTCE